MIQARQKIKQTIIDYNRLEAISLRTENQPYTGARCFVQAAGHGGCPISAHFRRLWLWMLHLLASLSFVPAASDKWLWGSDVYARTCSGKSSSNRRSTGYWAPATFLRLSTASAWLQLRIGFRTGCYIYICVSPGHGLTWLTEDALRIISRLLPWPIKARLQEWIPFFIPCRMNYGLLNHLLNSTIIERVQAQVTTVFLRVSVTNTIQRPCGVFCAILAPFGLIFLTTTSDFKYTINK